MVCDYYYMLGVYSTAKHAAVISGTLKERVDFMEVYKVNIDIHQSYVFSEHLFITAQAIILFVVLCPSHMLRRLLSCESTLVAILWCCPTGRPD